MCVANNLIPFMQGCDRLNYYGFLPIQFTEEVQKLLFE